MDYSLKSERWYRNSSAQTIPRIPKELLINEHYIKSDLKRKQEPMMEEGTTPTSAGCSILLDDSEL